MPSSALTDVMAVNSNNRKEILFIIFCRFYYYCCCLLKCLPMIGRLDSGKSFFTVYAPKRMIKSVLMAIAAAEPRYWLEKYIPTFRITQSNTYFIISAIG